MQGNFASDKLKKTHQRNPFWPEYKKTVNQIKPYVINVIESYFFGKIGKFTWEITFYSNVLQGNWSFYLLAFSIMFSLNMVNCTATYTAASSHFNWSNICSGMLNIYIYASHSIYPMSNDMFVMKDSLR